MNNHGNDKARLFNCANCNKQIIICSCCDRGNIYCKDCAVVARKKSKNAAAKRYQNTLNGKLNHANRQKAYRLRQKQKVTHQGSIEIDNYVALASNTNVELTDIKNSVSNVSIAIKQVIICDFCGKYCSSFLKNEFNSYTKHKNHKVPINI